MLLPMGDEQTWAAMNSMPQNGTFLNQASPQESRKVPTAGTIVGPDGTFLTDILGVSVRSVLSDESYGSAKSSDPPSFRQPVRKVPSGTSLNPPEGEQPPETPLDSLDFKAGLKLRANPAPPRHRAWDAIRSLFLAELRASREADAFSPSGAVAKHGEPPGESPPSSAFLSVGLSARREGHDSGPAGKTDPRADGGVNCDHPAPVPADEVEARRIAAQLDRLHRDGAIASKAAYDPDAVFYAKLLRDFGAIYTGRSGSRRSQRQSNS